MGRTREYGSDAERQKAFRDRRNEELQRLRKATAKRPAASENAPLHAEIERLRKRVAGLEATLAAAKSTPPKPARGQGPVTTWTEPFPHVFCGIGGDDFAATGICNWFENRIVEGTLSPLMLSIAASNLDYLAQAYWGRNGMPKACKPLTREQKAAVVAERKRKRTAAAKGV